MRPKLPAIPARPDPRRATPVAEWLQMATALFQAEVACASLPARTTKREREAVREHANRIAEVLTETIANDAGEAASRRRRSRKGAE